MFGTIGTFTHRSPTVQHGHRRELGMVERPLQAELERAFYSKEKLKLAF